MSETIKSEVVLKSPDCPDPPQFPAPDKQCLRIGIAQDTAFCFYYEENKRALRQQGLELVEFSPMEDKKLPEGICGLYLGGGYPELHAGKLSENSGMRHAIFEAVRHGMPTIAECGGFLYLQKELEDAEGGLGDDRRFGWKRISDEPSAALWIRGHDSKRKFHAV